MNKIRKQMRRSHPSSSGFSLIEMVIAIAVFSVTFIGIIGLLGLGLATTQTSSQQTVATNIVDSIVADLHSTPSYSTTGKSIRYNLPLPTAVTATPATPLSGLTPTKLYFDNNQTVVSGPSSAVYVAYVYTTQIVQVGPVTTPNLTQAIDFVRVAVAWPAQAKTPDSGSVDIITQFRVN